MPYVSCGIARLRPYRLSLFNLKIEPIAKQFAEDFWLELSIEVCWENAGIIPLDQSAESDARVGRNPPRRP
jgi:hypothetical protein